MGERNSRPGGRLYFFLAWIMIAPVLMCGCIRMYEGYFARSSFDEANNLFNRGDYRASLGKYEQIIKKYPSASDRALFEMGVIHAYAGNEQKDYQQSLELFQALVRQYPDSRYRQNSEVMISHINNVLIKDRTIKAQQRCIDALERRVKAEGIDIITKQREIENLKQEIANRGSELAELQKRIGDLELKIFSIQHGHADKILIEKKVRRLTLLSKGKAIKTYKIALGGNPVGPKERQGDNKTPEGTYVIDSRNRNSIYHLSLRISYPNEKDKQRAKELGVSPGGDIMIHGIMKGFSQVGKLHTERDWTKGCIAVTDQEIEEIDSLVPNGTVVEIRP